MQAVKQYLRKELEGIFPISEIEGIERLIFDKVCNLDYTGIIVNRNKIIDSEKRKEIEDIIRRLKQHEPIQYILGETEFYKLRLKVNPSVLIPRPETEELVHWIVSADENPFPKILDIGTGSGCISLAIKSKMSRAQVLGIDISKPALDVARENAILNKLKVDFRQVNILQWEKYNWDFFDVIVSNPPYVRHSEKEQMQSNVLDFEPDLALYVKDEEPLVFYKVIAEFAKMHIKKGGYLYFEINEKFADETRYLLLDLSYSDIEIKKDLYGKDRMVRCINV